eukprot:4386471-Amphidinium_carterae.1
MSFRRGQSQKRPAAGLRFLGEASRASHCFGHLTSDSVTPPLVALEVYQLMTSQPKQHTDCDRTVERNFNEAKDTLTCMSCCRSVFVASRTQGVEEPQLEHGCMGERANT